MARPERRHHGLDKQKLTDFIFASDLLKKMKESEMKEMKEKKKG